MRGLRFAVLSALLACSAAFSVGSSTVARVLPSSFCSKVFPLSSRVPAVRRAPRSTPLMQLGEMPGDKQEDQGAEITEEMMMLLALQQRQKQALPEGSKVIVFGALDRLGQLVVRMLAANGRYKPAIQTSKGYEAQMKFSVDGVDPGFPPEAQVAFEEIPADVSAAILCVEQATDAETLKAVLSLGLPLKKFVLLSKVGVDSRETDWKLKLNPFLKLPLWAALEETLKESAELSGFDYSIVRVGELSGGPFFDSNRDFAQALEDRIYDSEAQGCLLKEGDLPEGGKITRDVAAQALVECLARPDATNKVMSIKCVKEKVDGAVKCDETNFLQLPRNRDGRDRVVYTPSSAQWAAAFTAAFP